MKSFCLILLLAVFFISCQEKTLFKKLDASFTGVTFENNLISSDTLNAFNFTNFYNGGGVAVADFNQDGILDLCFTANQKNPELYLGLGQMKFQKMESSGLYNGGWVNGISVVDINQDGWPDIYLSLAKHSAFKSSKNCLFINQKTKEPSFMEEASLYGLDFEGYTTQTAFFDYDRDGDLDAFLLNTSPDSYNPNYLRPGIHDGSSPAADKLYENIGLQENGKYFYKDVSLEEGITYEGLGLGIGLGDFNEDGITDIYTSADFQSDDALYLGAFNAPFQNQIKNSARHTSLFGMGMEVVDLNNDGLLDIFQLDMLPEESDRQKLMISRADFEKKRISVAHPYFYNLQYMRNAVQINAGIKNGIPLFKEQGLMLGLAATDWSWSVLCADFDLDGQKDVFITNGYRKNVTDLDFVTYYQQNRMFGTDASQSEKREALLDEVPEIRLKNVAFKNQGSGPFQNVSDTWGLDQDSYSNGAVYADLDQDGDLDLVVNNIDERAYIYENTLEEKNMLEVSLVGLDGNKEGIGAKIRTFSNGKVQRYDYFPVRGYLSSLNTPITIGIGKEKLDSLSITWQDGTSETINQPSNKLVLYQKNASLRPIGKKEKEKWRIEDLVQNHQESAFIDFNQTPTLQQMLSRNGPVLAMLDVNGDGKEDILQGGSFRGSNTYVYSQTSNGGFELRDSIPTNFMELGDILVLDVEGDGKKEVLLVPGYAEVPFQKNETFSLKLVRFTTTSPILEELPIYTCSNAAALIDVDGDMKEEIVLGGSYLYGQFPYSCESIVLKINKGEISPWNVRGLPTWAVSDISTWNKDGRQEMLFVGHWQAPVVVNYSGSNSFSFKEIGLKSGWWNCAKTEDVNGDGLPDFILGNEGLNHMHKVSEENPVKLVAKDFNQDGKIDPIYSTYLVGKEVILHPLVTLTEQIIQFKKRFIQFKDFALTSWDDIFGKGDLEGALQLQVEESRSGYALNQGDGTFSFVPFPFEVQSAPIQDFVYEDVTGDGRKDFVLVGNFYPKEAIYGQSDASYGFLLDGETHQISSLGLMGDARRACYLPEWNKLLVSFNSFGVKQITFNP